MFVELAMLFLLLCSLFGPIYMDPGNESLAAGPVTFRVRARIVFQPIGLKNGTGLVKKEVNLEDTETVILNASTQKITDDAVLTTGESTSDLTTGKSTSQKTRSSENEDDENEINQICGKTEFPKTKYINDGNPISRNHTWPWQVSLYAIYSPIDFGYLCGGAVISRYWILTAAHCFFFRDPRLSELLEKPESWEARAGETRQYTFETFQQRRNLSSIVRPPGFKYPYRPSDIALLKTTEPFVFGEQVQPICIPPPAAYLKGSCYMVGYPTQPPGKIVTGNVYHQISLPIIPHDVCTTEEYYGSKITHDMICAGHEAGGPDSCQGDSGRPLTCLSETNQWYSLGVSSWALGCGLPKKPGIYTSVSHYVNWIKQQVYSKPLRQISEH